MIPKKSHLDINKLSFIERNLRDLREGKFIIFQLGTEVDHYMQLANEANEILLDFPVWVNTVREDKGELFKRILEHFEIIRKGRLNTLVSGMKNRYILIKGDKGYAIQANLADDYKLASFVTLTAGMIVYNLSEFDIKIQDTGELRYYN